MNRRSNLAVVGYLLLVFLAGAAVGGFSDHLYFSRHAHSRLTPEEYKNLLIKELHQRLNLQAGQLQKLNAIFDETGAHYREIHKHLEPDMAALRSEHDDKVRAILTPDQRAEYDKWRAERELQRATEPK